MWRFIHNPATRVLIVSAGDTQATEIANWVIQIVNNMPELACLRPDRANGDRASVEAFDIHYTLKGPEKSPSGSSLTFESHLGFPCGAGRASLTHANWNIHHVEAFGTRAIEGYFEGPQRAAEARLASGDRAAFG